MSEEINFLEKKGLKRRFATKFNNKTYRFETVEEAVQFRRSQKCPV